MDISVEIDPTIQPNRIRRQVSSSRRIIVPMPIIMQPRLAIIVLAR